MAKISRHGGATDATTEPSAAEEVASSPGTSSSASLPKPEPSKSSTPSESGKPARTTESPTSRDRTAGSTADSTHTGRKTKH